MIATQPAPAEAKPRFPNALGMQVASQLCYELRLATDRLVVAGSLRRRKATIGDIEILFIPKYEMRKDPTDMFDDINVNLADEVIARLEESGVLERRKNSIGSEMFGPENKLMRHCDTGLLVELFSATPATWYNRLVCRTGPAESNTRIAKAAIRMGWHWNPYGPGFSKGGVLGGERQIHAVSSEEEVFKFVGLPYLKPEQRV